MSLTIDTATINYVLRYFSRCIPTILSNWCLMHIVAWDLWILYTSDPQYKFPESFITHVDVECSIRIWFV